MNVLFVCHLGVGTGVGHFSRLMVVAKMLDQHFNANIQWLIQGNKLTHNDLDKFLVTFITAQENLAEKLINLDRFDLVVFDLNSELMDIKLNDALISLQNSKAKLVAIDGLLNYRKYLDLIFIPSFHLSSKIDLNLNGAKIKYGWDCFLIDADKAPRNWQPGKRILALTGGSDSTFLGNSLPSLLNEKLPRNSILDWVKGPFATMPIRPRIPKIRMIEHEAPNSLNSIMNISNYAITIYGVSFFELLRIGIPTVVFSPYGERDNFELKIIQELGLAMVANNEYEATEILVELMQNDILAQELSNKAIKKMKFSGIESLAIEIKALML